MKNIVITGVIGSGKTQFCKKFFGKNFSVGAPHWVALACRNTCKNTCKGEINRRPYFYISVDDIGKIFLPQYLQKRNITKQQLKKKLFFSPKNIHPNKTKTIGLI